MHSEEGGRIGVWQQQLQVPVSLRGCGSLKHSLPSPLIRFKEYGTSARWREVCGARSAGVRRTTPERASCPRRDTLTLYLIQVSRCVRKFSPSKPLLRVRNIFPFQGSWLLASVTCRSKEGVCHWTGKYAFTSQAWPSWFFISVITTATLNVI